MEKTLTCINLKKAKTKSYRNLDEVLLHCRHFFVCVRFWSLDFYKKYVWWITDLIDLFASYTQIFSIILHAQQQQQ